MALNETVNLFTDTERLPAWLKALVDGYQLKVISELSATAFEYTLHYQDDALSLTANKMPNLKPINVDFYTPKQQRRLQHASKANEDLLKAISIKGTPKLKIVDATAGFGQDAFLMASRGHHITCIEQHPVVYALLKDGLEHAKAHGEIAKHIELINGQATEAIPTLPVNPDIVYLDPMFAAKQKNALANKGMQILQQLIGYGKMEDASSLLKCAKQHAKLRVIVKRHLKALPLANAKPNFSFNGKTTRFDVYTAEAAV